MTDYTQGAAANSPYSRDLIDSLPHSPWLVSKPTPKVRFRSDEQKERRNATKRRNRALAAAKKLATRVNPESHVCRADVPNSTLARR